MKFRSPQAGGIRKRVEETSTAACVAETDAVLATVLDLVIIEPYRVGQPDLWKLLVGIYLEDTPASLEALGQAIAKKDYAAIHLSAHTLKSTSANVGAAKLSGLCRQLEMASRDADPANCPALLEEICREFGIVSDVLACDIGHEGVNEKSVT